MAERLADRTSRSRDSYKFQMLYGIRPNEQRRPADLAFFLRALASRG